MSSIPGDFARNICRCADSECEHRQEMILEFPKKIGDRVKGQLYMKKGNKGTWDGRKFRYACCQGVCNKRPHFNYEGQTRGQYCGAVSYTHLTLPTNREV